MNNNQIEEFFIWDEKNLTEHQTNYENKTENGMNVTIPETKKESNKKSLKDTTKNEWKRNCPTCDKEISYSYKCSLLISKKENTSCITCRSVIQRGKILVNKKHFTNKRNCPQCGNIIVYPDGNIKNKAEKHKRKCRNCAGNVKIYSHDKTDWKKNCPICNKVQTYKHMKSYKRALKTNQPCVRCTNIQYSNQGHVRLKRRLIRLNQHTPNFNPNACKYFDKLNEENGWKLKHAMNGGETRMIGYSLDAYDRENNIVVEYDEFRHYDKSGNLKHKDVIRQERIIQHLNCKFFRYNEITSILVEVNIKT